MEFFGKILGVIWIGLGILWLWKPGMLRNRMGRKTSRRFRWPLYAFLFFLALNLLKMVFAFDHLVFKIAGVIGVFVLIRFAWGLQSRAFARFAEWWGTLPLVLFRGLALCSVGAGLALFL